MTERTYPDRATTCKCDATRDAAGYSPGCPVHRNPRDPVGPPYRLRPGSGWRKVPYTDARTLLVDARELVRRGWAKGNWAHDKWGNPYPLDHLPPPGTPGCSYCATAAVYACATDVTPWSVTSCAMSRLAEQIPVRVLGPTARVPAYNDAPGVTRSDVLAMFDRAIASFGEWVQDPHVRGCLVWVGEEPVEYCPGCGGSPGHGGTEQCPG